MNCSSPHHLLHQAFTNHTSPPSSIISQQAPALTSTSTTTTTVSTIATTAAAAAAAAAASLAPPSPSPSPPAGQFQTEHLLPPQKPSPPTSTFSDQVLAPPITPPADSALDPRAEKILSTATHVLATEATALSCLSRLYATDPLCRHGFIRAVEAIVESQKADGKIIVIGVGKSGKIGDKLVATLNSLDLLTTFLSPMDALHGDLGIVRKNDILLLITFSGKTPELLQLLPHLPVQLPLIALTSHKSYHTLPLIKGRENAILLPAPIPESEVASFGVAAPTTSTTVAMALGDALAIAAADSLHDIEGMGPREVFRKNHPGGAIGMANKLMASRGCGGVRGDEGGGGAGGGGGGGGGGSAVRSGGVERMRALAVSWADIAEAGPTTTDMLLSPSPASYEISPDSDIDLDWNNDDEDAEAGSTSTSTSISSSSSSSVVGGRSSSSSRSSNSSSSSSKVCYGNLRVLDCLRLAVKSPKGWLRTADDGLIPPKTLLACHQLMDEVHAPHLGLVLDINELVKMSAETPVTDAARTLRSRRAQGELGNDSVVVLVENGKVYGVVEVGDVLERSV